jgi:hypothetical protein
MFRDDPYLLQERRQAEQAERDRVLWLISIRLDIWRALARRGSEEERHDAPGILTELEELEQAVRWGVHR